VAVVVVAAAAVAVVVVVFVLMKEFRSFYSTLSMAYIEISSPLVFLILAVTIREFRPMTDGAVGTQVFLRQQTFLTRCKRCEIRE
jgi:hypothetical protein